MNRNYIALFLSVFFLIGAFYITNQVTQETKEYKKKKELVVNDILGFQKRLLNYKEALPEIWDKEWQQKKVKSETILLEAHVHYEKAKQKSYWLVAESILFFLIMFFVFVKSKPLWAVCYSFLIISLGFMYLGVSAPIMELSAFNENLEIPISVTKDSFSEKLEKWKWAKHLVPEFEWDLTRRYPGKNYYFYQNKSILSTSGYLWQGGERVLAILILTFSILIPIVKSGISFLMLLSKSMKRWARLEKWVGFLSKLSMADVFAIALLLAFLGTSSLTIPIESESRALLGMYYFVGGVILSIISSLLLKRVVVKSEKKITQ